MISTKAAFCVAAAAIAFSISGPASANEWKMNTLLERVNMIPEAEELTPTERREFLCMALNIYHESRGESPQGRAAVSHVVLNRVASNRFQSTVCGVVWASGQFSWTVRPVGSLIPRERGAWLDSQALSMEVLYNETVDPTGGATHFYNFRISTPRWANNGVSVWRHGAHAFVRMW